MTRAAAGHEGPDNGRYPGRSGRFRPAGGAEKGQP